MILPKLGILVKSQSYDTYSELLQFTTLYKLVKYDDTIYVVILDIDSFPNLCGIPIYTSWCQLNLICLYFIDIYDTY